MFHLGAVLHEDYRVLALLVRLTGRVYRPAHKGCGAVAVTCATAARGGNNGHFGEVSCRPCDAFHDIR
jgi:hypothetical protein